MKKALFNLVIFVYVIIAIIVTIFLLSYNEHKVTQIGGFTFILMKDDEISEEYQKGSLVIANGNKLKNVQAGDNLFFYDDNGIQYGEVKEVHEYENSANTFVMDGNHKVPEDIAIGASKDTITIPNLGKILGVLESKWGFLFIIIVPSLLAFFKEIMALVVELKEN